MVINKSFNLIIDFENQKSLIQYLLEKERIKEVNFIVDYLIKNNNENNDSLEIIYPDLMQLLYFKKFNLNDFLNIDKQEEYLSSDDKLKEKLGYFCNLEQIIITDKLP